MSCCGSLRKSTHSDFRKSIQRGSLAGFSASDYHDKSTLCGSAEVAEVDFRNVTTANLRIALFLLGRFLRKSLAEVSPYISPTLKGSGGGMGPSLTLRVSGLQPQPERARMATPPRTRADGTNPRAEGTNPRATGTNDRSQALNKWALRNWKRAQKAAANAQPEPQRAEPTWADRMGEWERGLRAKAKPKPASTDPEWTKAIRAWKAKAKTMGGPSA